jgi:hypothetical protein
MTKALYVIDPGLMEAGGHHAALLDTLIVSEHVGFDICVKSHVMIDDDLKEKATRFGIKVEPHFNSNFYEHYDDSLFLKISGMQFFIRQLAFEYGQVLRELQLVSNSEKITCLYPCLNWEHAAALNLAISLLPKNMPTISHKICCMFKPMAEGSEGSVHYRLAFSQLSRNNGVQLYASDWETREYYADLGIPIVGFHPCYLLPWQSLLPTKSTQPDIPHFLLYMGDAKLNKGFDSLPALVERYLDEYLGNVRLTIQYTLAWENPELKAAINKLELLSKRHHQLELHKHFWPTSELVKVINSVTAIVCTYDADVYQKKSSGLAWLAAFFNKSVILQGESWLSREFERLRHPYIVNPSRKQAYFENADVRLEESDYYKALFSDFFTWLQS